VPHFVGILVTALLSGAACAVPPAEEWDIKAVRWEGEVIVDAIMYAPVAPREAWAVLTDFERMAEFVPNLQSSHVLSKPGEHLVRIAQKGAGRLGPFSFPFESVRELELVPYEIMKAKNISGNMRKMQSTTRLIPEGTGTRLEYHLEVMPNYWVPPLIGPAFIREGVRNQFRAIVGEMARRQGVAAPKPVEQLKPVEK